MFNSYLEILKIDAHNYSFEEFFSVAYEALATGPDQRSAPFVYRKEIKK